ncbi:MAG: hypothetical protein AABY93_18880 [Bacteroidota bacterium]
MILLDLATGDWIGILGLAILIGGALTTLIVKSTTLSNTVDYIKTDVGDMKFNVAKISGMEVKVEELWRQKTTQSASPMILNAVGKKIMSDSKIKELTDKYYTDILSSVKDKNPENPFQAQEILINVVKLYKDKDECKLKLEEAAFNSGNNVDTILFVAAIDIRDQIVLDLGFSRDDIDKHDPSKNQAKTGV